MRIKELIIIIFFFAKLSEVSARDLNRDESWELGWHYCMTAKTYHLLPQDQAAIHDAISLPHDHRGPSRTSKTWKTRATTSNPERTQTQTDDLRIQSSDLLLWGRLEAFNKKHPFSVPISLMRWISSCVSLILTSGIESPRQRSRGGKL